MVFSAYVEEQRDLRWVTVTLTSIATILLCCRLITTWRNRGWLGMEDAFVVSANIFLVAFTAMVYMSTTYGFGTHAVDIKKSGGNISKAMQFFWLTQVFYTLCNGLNKMSFLALYYRVFAIKPFRRACMTMMAICISWTVSYVFVAIFQCTPIHRTWDRTVPGHCINFFWHRWSNAISNLVTDLIIFFMPMPVIMRLKMSVGNKIGLIVLFSMGFFICLITMLRMATLPLTLKTKEPTWESAPTNLWSFIEAAVGVICSCLISLRKSISSLWPARWRSTKGSSYGQYGQYGQPGSGKAISGLGRSGQHGTAGMYPLESLESVKNKMPGKTIS
ncbi:uncharacterized protein BDR25DRAFT_344281 [Lindgomyces ingoldianus]|uniref:Uncharacterized protein n=1 Tax=Lindgomyces ingoldianus TaxID=673940 RepID=A0ACB6QNH4_9PLEO|nr:uncharacterized protein BDR25DRAFT_344281 [Lindgomyces ingoldianus]KAF2468574.1 hypothetical protein BDR25DRAFT_344281 [Lindgomyces ingoldianus]